MVKLAVALFAASICPGAFAKDPGENVISPEVRARAQRDLERIDHRHRLDAAQMAALESYWKIVPSDELLARELARLAGEITPAVRLAELFDVLGNDPSLISECLARPALVERVSRDLFAFDPAIHAGARAEAVALRRRLVSGELSPWSDYPGRSVFDLTRRSPSGVGQVSPIAEERDGFVLSVVLSETPRQVRVAKYVVTKMTFDAWLGNDGPDASSGPDLFSFCAPSGAGIVLWVDGDRSSASLLDAAGERISGDGGSWMAPYTGVYFARVARELDLEPDAYLLSIGVSDRAGIVEAADIELTTYVSPVPAVSGSLLTYTIVVQNAGPDAALDAEMLQLVPDDVTFESLTVPVAGDGPWACTTPSVGARGKVSCTKKCFAPGSQATFTVTVRVASCLGSTTLPSTITASSLTSDPNLENNVAVDETAVMDYGSCDDGEFCTTGDRCGPGPAAVFQENFDGVPQPALPAGWTAVLVVGPDGGRPWRSVGLNFDTGPNSVFSADAPDIRDSVLDSPGIPIASPAAKLRFRNRFDIEKDNDGGVLEIKIGNGAFVDILAAGGSFVEGGYNGTISVSFGSPIAGRQAWTGLSAGFVPTTVNLPAAAAGKTIVLRWRLATDRSLGKVGQWIDTVSISGRDVCATGTQFTCEDHDACTIDSCDPVLGCGYIWVACDDGKLCTNDFCDPIYQCVHTNNVAPCDDHDACTLEDACAGGVCVGGPTVVCQDADRCTADVCDPVAQCLSSTTNFDTTGFSAGRVDGRDLAVFAAAWNSCLGTERYNPAADLDHQMPCIGSDDFHFFMLSFGLSCPP
jgi:uncharacterized repeat protein (TIGR01451 family)